MRYEDVFNQIPYEEVVESTPFPVLELKPIPLQTITIWFAEITQQLYPVRRVRAKVRRRITG
jgi:hypothetical protein